MTAEEERELRTLAWRDWQITKCRRKTMFYSREAAEMSIDPRNRSRRGRHTPPKLASAYKCSWCDGWHHTLMKQTPPELRAAA